jgi:hypothetical protein
LAPSFIAFFAQQERFTMATTIITSSQYTPMGSFGYYSQSTATTIDSITSFKRQFWRQAQQPKQYTFRQRTASPPRKCLDPTRGHLSEDHLAIGMVVFLPPKNPNRDNCTCILPNCQRRQLLDKGYNHPALVLGIRDNRKSGGELTALCCIVSHTSFFTFGTNSNPRQISGNSKPIADEPASKFALTQIQKGINEAPTTAPNGSTTLYLEPESSLLKKSHVGDLHVYAIPITQLVNLGKPLENRLTKKSYEALIASFPSLTPGKWIATADLANGEHDPAIHSALPAPVPVRQGPVIQYNQHELLAVQPYADKNIAAAINNVIEVRFSPIKRAACPTIIPTKKVTFEISLTNYSR